MPNPYQPTCKAGLSPTFTWPSVAGAATYRFFLQQNKVTPQPNITLTSAQVNDDGIICTYTPSKPIFPIPLTKGYYATWWVQAYNLARTLIVPPGSVENSFWPDDIDSTTNIDFNLGYVDHFDTAGCLYYPAGTFTDAGRRVLDLFLYYNGGIIDPINSEGIYAFPENTWSKFNISDLVPSNTKAISLSLELISSSLSPLLNADPDLLGYNFARYNSGILNTPIGVARYSVANRTPIEITVPVGQDQYGETQLMALWSHTANGIDVAATNKSVVTGRAYNASIIGYYAS